ncbi:SpaA isopeptide-forming pilin-related protein, partial [Ruminococcus sp. AF37-20]|uniref:MSCRAMM family protein n=1 Tax=Ruminococcus sp. AF37-20 TaxID=2293178 RepID=UPI001A9A557E
TTDENGYFKTKEYVCGNYTVQEISPSEGYLLDKTVYSVGAEAENYSIEHNPISMTVTEDVIKGNIAIIKHSDDGSTQIETPEVGAEFEVYLKSSGSYEAARDSEKDYLVCDENGYAATKMLPYGTYIVHQT